MKEVKVTVQHGIGMMFLLILWFILWFVLLVIGEVKRDSFDMTLYVVMFSTTALSLVVMELCYLKFANEIVALSLQLRIEEEKRIQEEIKVEGENKKCDMVCIDLQ